MQNLVILAGNVGATPEVRTTQGGTKITNFSLATSRPKRDQDGKTMKDGEGRRVEDTEWHRITCFNGVGKTVAQYVEKGQKVMVRGRIHYTPLDRRSEHRALRCRDHRRRSDLPLLRQKPPGTPRRRPGR